MHSGSTATGKFESEADRLVASDGRRDTFDSTDDNQPIADQSRSQGWGDVAELSQVETIVTTLCGLDDEGADDLDNLHPERHARGPHR